MMLWRSWLACISTGPGPVILAQVVLHQHGAVALHWGAGVHHRACHLSGVARSGGDCGQSAAAAAAWQRCPAAVSAGCGRWKVCASRRGGSAALSCCSACLCGASFVNRGDCIGVMTFTGPPTVRGTRFGRSLRDAGASAQARYWYRYPFGCLPTTWLGDVAWCHTALGRGLAGV